MKTKIIVEIGYNHNGSIDQARALVDEACKLDVWGIKFQKWDIDGFPNELKKKKRTDKHAYGKTYYEHRKFLELSIDQLKDLKKYVEDKGKVFICSGKDIKSVKELVEKVKCKYIKLPSQRYKDNEIFKYLYYKKNDLFIMVSTGMEYHKLINKSRWTKEADVIMHCVSKYPAQLKDCDLGVLDTFKFYNGYSSHEEGGKAISYAVAMGAEYIERHFTLDKEAKGTDHQVSSDPAELKKIIEEIKFVEMIKGTGKRQLTKEEVENRLFYRGF